MGPSVKFVLAIIDSISKKKMGVNFFSRKIGHEGGGSEGFVSVDAKNPDLHFWIFPLLFLLSYYLYYLIVLISPFGGCPTLALPGNIIIIDRSQTIISVIVNIFHGNKFIVTDTKTFLFNIQLLESTCLCGTKKTHYLCMHHLYVNHTYIHASCARQHWSQGPKENPPKEVGSERPPKLLDVI